MRAHFSTFASRLRAAIGQRDWFGVFVEVGAVVLGVLLGLQASQWADARKAEAERAALYERLATDLRAYADSENWRRDLRLERLERMGWMAEQLDAGTLRNAPREDTIAALDDVISFNEPPSLPIAFENLIASNGLERLEPEVRRRMEGLARTNGRQIFAHQFLNDMAIANMPLAMSVSDQRLTDYVKLGDDAAVETLAIHYDVIESRAYRRVLRDALMRDAMLERHDRFLTQFAEEAADELEAEN